MTCNHANPHCGCFSNRIDQANLPSDKGIKEAAEKMRTYPEYIRSQGVVTGQVGALATEMPMAAEEGGAYLQREARHARHHGQTLDMTGAELNAFVLGWVLAKAR